MQMALIEYTIVGLIHCQTRMGRGGGWEEGLLKANKYCNPELSHIPNTKDATMLCIAVTFATIVPFP